MAALNLELLMPKKKDLAGVGEVKAPDIFTGFSRDFHPEGLFSVETFGKVGSERRNQAFGFIDLGTSVLHPVLYKTLISMKEFYQEILSGKGYAIFDPKLKDFVKSDIVNGRTGYSFFMEHYAEIQFESRDSNKRDFSIMLHEKYREDPVCEYVVVLPAGLRDLEVDESGRPTEDEVNKMYRRVLSYASMARGINTSINLEYLDSTRYSLQLAFNELYDYFMSVMDGKNKMVLGKWASRAIFDSTRNVITSPICTAVHVDDPRLMKATQTAVGIYQFFRAALPLNVFKMKTEFLKNVFLGPNAPAVLVNPKTLHKETVHIKPETYTAWMTYDGLQKLGELFEEPTIRHDPVIIEGRYVGLVYKGPNKEYRLFQDIDELPADFDKKNVSPITLTELIYLSICHESDRVPCLPTRYPASGNGSIFCGFTYLKSTVTSEVRYELGYDWQRTGRVVNEFPITDEAFHESMTIPNMHIKRSGADFDGDTMNYIAVMTEDAIQEITDILNSRDHFVDMNGDIVFDPSTDSLDLLFKTITG